MGTSPSSDSFLWLVAYVLCLRRCSLRTGSRLLSGAQMEEYSQLLEHALLPSGDIAERGAIYAGWPARMLEQPRAGSGSTTMASSASELEKGGSTSSTLKA